MTFLKQISMFLGSVLVHCLMGMSRSATLVIAFLVKTRSRTVLEAFKEVKSRNNQYHNNAKYLHV